MALADATVRVILDVSRFDRDLQSKVESSARKAGRTWEKEFTKSAGPAGQRYAKEFRTQAAQGMSGAGNQIGQEFGTSIRRNVVPTGRGTGRDLGTQIRGGLVNTAPGTGRAYGRGVLSGGLLAAGGRIGQLFGNAIGNNINISGGGAGNRIQRSIERDTEPNMRTAAATIARNFGNFLSGTLGALAPGRMVIFGSAIAALVSEGAQLVAAVAPALQAIGLLPGLAAVAAAAVGTLAIAFKGVGEGVSAALAGDTKKLNEALAGLAPSAQKVVREFSQFGPQLTKLKSSVQQAFFAQLTGSVTALGKALIGPVQRGMVSTASAAGGLASSLVGVVAQARNASVVEQVFQSAAGAFKKLAAPLASLTQGLISWVGATLPGIDRFVASLATGTQRFGQFLSRAASSGQAMAWVNEAVTTLSQLWNVAKNLSGVLGAIFSSANSASGGYLANINQALIATKQFLASGEGHTALTSLFDGLHQVLAALGAPLKEIVLQLGTVAQVAGSVATALSAGVTGALRGIGEGIAAAGPGLTNFASSVGSALSTIGAALPSIGASLGRALTAIAPLAQVFGGVTQAVALLLNVFTRLPTGILTVIAAFTALRFLGVPKMFSALTDGAKEVPGALSRVGTAFTSLTSSYRSNLDGLTAIRHQQQTLALVMNGGVAPTMGLGNAFGGLADRARAAGSVVGGALKNIGSSLLNLAGGGVGIALAAVSFLISHWAEENDKAAREVADHNARVSSLTSTLDKVTGSITSATRAEAESIFTKGDLADATRRLGVSTELASSAALNSVPAQRNLNSILQDSARGVLETSDAYKNGRTVAETYGVSLDTVASAARGNTQAQDEVRAAVQRYHDQLPLLERVTHDVDKSYQDFMTSAKGLIPDQLKLGDATSKTAEQLTKQGEAIRKANAAFDPAQKLAQSLADAMAILATNTSSAEDKARALDTALRILAGGTLDMQDAQKKAVDSLTAGNETLAKLSEKYDLAGKSAKTLGISNQELKTRQDELGKSLFDSAGNVNFFSERANTLFEVSKGLRQATLDQTAAIIDNAQKTGGDLTKAHQQAADVMVVARQRVIDWAKELGFGQKDAERFADSLQLIPEDVKVALTMPGVPALLQTLGSLKGRIDLLPDNKTLKLDSNAAPMRTQLEKLGFTIKDIPGTKDFTIVPNTAEAAAAVNTFINQSVVNRRPDMFVGANIDLAKAKSEDLRKFIESLPATITPEVNPGPAQSQARSLLDTLIPPPGSPLITPGLNPGIALDGLGDLMGGLTPPPGTPLITPGLNPGIALGGLSGLLSGLTPPKGQPQISPGINPGTAQGQMPGFLGSLIPPTGQPQIAPGLNPGAALGTLNGLLLPAISRAHADVGVGIQPASAQQGLSGLIVQINSTRGNVAVGANTSAAGGAIEALVGGINRRSAAIQVGANTGLALGAVDGLVQQVNKRTAKINVSANTAIQAAGGGIFAYRSGGVHDPSNLPKMSARRAAIVPPNSARVIGDRGWGRELFLPLVRSSTSYGLLRQAANELNFDLTPRTSGGGSQSTGRTVTVQAGAIVVNAPNSNPRLVARSVVNELVQEAVV